MASALLGCEAFPCGGRCGRASLPPAPSYGLQPLGAALSRRAAVGGGAFPGHAKPPGMDI
jgi:hypothetical protein